MFMCLDLFLFESFYNNISYFICTFFIFVFIFTMFILLWLLSWKGTIQSTYSFHVYFCIHYFLYLFGSCLFQYTFGIIDYSFTFIYSYLFLFEFFFTIILYFIILFQWAPPMPQEGIKISHGPNLKMFDTFSLDVNVFSVFWCPQKTRICISSLF